MSTNKLRQWPYGLPTAISLLAPMNILASLGMDIYLPVVPLMPGILGANTNVIQLTLTLYMILLGTGQVIFGPLSDSIGRRPVMLGGTAIFAVASFGLAFSTHAGIFLLFRVLQAIGASAAMVAILRLFETSMVANLRALSFMV